MLLAFGYPDDSIGTIYGSLTENVIIPTICTSKVYTPPRAEYIISTDAMIWAAFA